MNDPIGDMLTRIRNAQMRGKSTVATPASKLRAWVLDVLQDEGYIRGYDKQTGGNGHPEIVIPSISNLSSTMAAKSTSARRNSTLML